MSTDCPETRTFWRTGRRPRRACRTNWAVATLTQEAAHRRYSLFVDIRTQDSNGQYEIMCYPGPDNTGALQEPCDGRHFSGSGFPYTDMVDGTNCTNAYVRLFDAAGNAIGFGDVVDPGC